MYGGRKQRRGPFRWCDFPVFFSVLSPIQMVHAKRGNIARDRRQQQRIHQPLTASGGKVLASQLSWHCEGVVRTGKRYLNRTPLFTYALHLGRGWGPGQLGNGGRGVATLGRPQTLPLARRIMGPGFGEASVQITHILNYLSLALWVVLNSLSFSHHLKVQIIKKINKKKEINFKK